MLNLIWFALFEINVLNMVTVQWTPDDAKLLVFHTMMIKIKIKHT